MIAGDRFVLVSSNVGNDTQGYDVLGYDNKFLGKFVPPRNFDPFTIRGDLVYGVETDEFDVQSVAVYRLIPPKQNAPRR